MNKIEEKHSSHDVLIRRQRAVLEIADKIYPIYDGINTVGRNPNAVINIKNITISQQHAIIVVIEEDKHFISDLKSSNGTFLNYNGLQPLSLYELNENDLIRFGDLNAIYKRRSNETNLDLQQIESAASQSMSQSFYMTNTQNVEVDNDFHEMDTEVFNTDHELASFHDLPTQVECFDVHVNENNATNEIENNNRNVTNSPFHENMQIDAFDFSEDLNKNTDNATNQSTDQEKINENNENTTNLLPIVDNKDDTSNDSIVLASKNNFDHEMRNQQINKIDKQSTSDSDKNETIKADIINVQSNENNDESSNESLDLVTMSKVAQSPCKFDDNLEQSQQIKPVILANSSRRIYDSDNSDLIENVKEQSIPKCNSDDETDIENAADDDDAENESLSIQTVKTNQTVNESDLIPATQDVDLQEPQASGVIDDSFDDSSFALDITDKVFESSDSNKADEETIQPTQQLNINVVVKHKNNNNIDELYLESTQKIENNCNKINEQPEKSIENNADEVNNVATKDNSSDNDLFALPETPKKSKRSKLNIDPKSSTSKDVEDELQHIFATQQEKFTCSQLVNILADSPEKQNKIQINDNNNNCNNNTSKVYENQNTTIEKSVSTITVDQNVEQELETIFQSQQDLTCSQLVRILDEPKDVKNSTTVSTIRNSPVKNCVEDSSTNSKEIQELDNTAKKHTKTLRRKLSKFASDREMEISNCPVNEEENKQNRTRNSRKRSISSNTDSQSSIASVSNDSSTLTTITMKDEKGAPKRKLKKITNTESDHQIENKNRRVTRSSQSSIENTSSSEEFFDTSNIKCKKVSLRNNSNEKIETVETTKNNNPRKRSATTEDVSNKKSTKKRLDQNTSISSKEAVEDVQTSGFSTDTSVSESTTNQSIANQKNKMSRRTRKNLNNSTLLLPVTVTVPKKEDNLKNDQKVTRLTRGQSSKKHTESISTPSDASSLSSSSSSSSPTAKTANIQKGKRRLSANSRSMKNLEKIEEQNENETGQKDQSKKNNGRKKSNLQENINQELNQSETINTPERTHRILKPKVVFTMMNSPELESVVRQLGGRVVDNTNACTVLVTEHVKRSAKLLSAVGQGKPICSPQWLLDSRKASHFLDPWDYILKDNEAEEKWNFKLHESLERSNRKKLMENYTFQLFVNEAADVLKGAIESCGGKCVVKYQSKNCSPNFVIVANPENKSKYNRIIKQNPDIRVVAPEAIFDGTLRQELQFERHLLL